MQVNSYTDDEYQLPKPGANIAKRLMQWVAIILFAL